jgi:hypothetical protein
MDARGPPVMKMWLVCPMEPWLVSNHCETCLVTPACFWSSMCAVTNWVFCWRSKSHSSHSSLLHVPHRKFSTPSSRSLFCWRSWFSPYLNPKPIKSIEMWCGVTAARIYPVSWFIFHAVCKVSFCNIIFALSLRVWAHSKAFFSSRNHGHSLASRSDLAIDTDHEFGGVGYGNNVSSLTLTSLGY